MRSTGSRLNNLRSTLYLNFTTTVFDFTCDYVQGRREPNVGPGLAQILDISSFAYSKTEGENATVFPDFDVISKKNKKNERSSIFYILISQCHFDWPSEAHGPRSHCSTLPLLSVALTVLKHGLFISRLETDGFIFFSSRFICSEIAD